MYSSNPIKQHLIDLDYKRKAANKPAFLQSGGWIGPEVPNVNSNLRFAINYHNKKSRMGRSRTRRSRQHGGILPALAAIPPAVMAAAPTIAGALGSAASAVGVPVAVDLVLDKIRSRKNKKQSGSGLYRPRTKRRTIDSYVQMGGSMKHIKQAVLDSPHTKKLIMAPLVGATEQLDKILQSQLTTGQRGKLDLKAIGKSYGKRVGGEMLKRAALIARHPAAIHALTSKVKIPLFTRLARKAVKKVHHMATGKAIKYGQQLQRGAGIVPRLNQKLARQLIMQDRLARVNGIRQKGAGIGAVAGILGSSLLPLGFDLIRKQIGFGGARRRRRRRRNQQGGFFGLIPGAFKFIKNQIGLGGVKQRRRRRRNQLGGIALGSLYTGGFLPMGLKTQIGFGRGSINTRHGQLPPMIVPTSSLPKSNIVMKKPALLPPIGTTSAVLPAVTRPATASPTSIPVITPLVPPSNQNLKNRVLDKLLVSGGIGDRVLNKAGAALINRAFKRQKTTKRPTTYRKSTGIRKKSTSTTRKKIIKRRRQ